MQEALEKTIKMIGSLDANSFKQKLKRGLESFLLKLGGLKKKKEDRVTWASIYGWLALKVFKIKEMLHAFSDLLEAPRNPAII